MYTAKGKADKNTLLEQQAPLVKKIAYQLKAKLPANVEVDDLIQAGMIGLLDALSRFDAQQGVQFETFASLRIRGAMLDELRQSDWMPRSVRQNMKKIEDAMRQLHQSLGRPPNETEVAKQLALSLDDYQSLLAESGGHQLLYYEDFHDDDESGSFLDSYADDEDSDPFTQLMHGSFRDALLSAISRLPEREKLLLGLYYEQELNLKEIGSIMSVSESRVSQLHSQAVGRLRTYLKENEWTAPV